MKLFLLQQNINDGWDTYDAAVVVAENEDEARKIHPSEFVNHVKNGKFMRTSNNIDTFGQEHPHDNNDWVSYSQIKKIDVTYIGEAAENLSAGEVVIASFNAA